MFHIKAEQQRQSFDKAVAWQNYLLDNFPNKAVKVKVVVPQTTFNSERQSKQQRFLRSKEKRNRRKANAAYRKAYAKVNDRIRDDRLERPGIV
jgi:hypothetical protein